MANPEQLQILREGVASWNAWRRSHRSVPVDLEEADLIEADLFQANLRKANLRGARLLEADLRRASLNGADLAGAFLVDAYLERARLRNVHLNGADLAEANFAEADLTGTDFRGANLWETRLVRARLEGANFELCRMEGANLGGATAAGAYFVDARLPRAFLEGADLSGCNFYEADLTQARLRDADLSGAFLNGAKLLEADLSSADLTGTDLTDADFKRAWLLGADLSQARLARTYFGDSNMGGTTLDGLDLGATLGLGAVIHYGPSRVDLETLALSRGQIPLSFLRGAGLPAPFVDYLDAFNWETIRYRSCFISYSSWDQEFAQKLHNDLSARGISCWLDVDDIRLGVLADELRQAIQRHDRFLLILSEHSMQSPWVRTELQEGLKRHTRENPVIIPVRLTDYRTLESWQAQGDDGTDLAAAIRELVIPDFTRWRDAEAYDKSFNLVLQALALHPEAPAGDE
ncbi:MAG TPA: pentapeptide repeat-containing protein [Thermoanaerobaculia bacterium]|nr:pentapeptide repeat-containing protein [Thermoanaerobaculia bacterium]